MKLNRNSFPMLASLLGLMVMFVSMAIAQSDPGLNPSSLENHSGLVRILIDDPASPTSMARLALPDGQSVDLAVVKGSSHLNMTVVSAPAAAEFRVGQQFQLKYNGSRIFSCHGDCGNLNLLQS